VRAAPACHVQAATPEGTEGTEVELIVKRYGNSTFVLEQRLPKGCKRTQAVKPVLPRRDVDGADDANPGIVSPFLSFPAWRRDGGLVRKLRFLTWQGAWHSTYQWTVQESHGVDITTPHPDGTHFGLAGLSSGPVVLMPSVHKAGSASIAFGPITHVKQSTSVLARIGNSTWEMGVSAEVLSVPAGFVHRTLITSAVGPTRAMVRWGVLARAEAQFQPRFEDVATSKLGYFTDNGAMLCVAASSPCTHFHP
jgi:hypothetical protein